MKLTEAEWSVMEALWAGESFSLGELTRALSPGQGWSKNTVITMLSRLESKGAVRYEEGSRAKRYFPAVAREDAAMAETENFLSKVYSGRLGLMMSAMVDSQALTEDDIAELTAILERAGGEHT